VANFTAWLSIGYPTAKQEVPFEVDDEDLECLTPDEREAYLWGQAEEAVCDYIEIWYEEN
jgi:hypothetical protein